jgi:hypothetical protein
MTSTKDDALKAVPELFEALRRDTEQLHQYCVLYEQLFTTQEAVDVLKSAAPAMFRMVQLSFAEAIELAICRLTDPPSTGNHANLSLDRLADLLSDPAQVALAANIKAQAVKLRQELEPTIRYLRDKLRAHNDRDAKLGKAHLPSVNWAMVKEAADAIADLMNQAQPAVLGDKPGDESGTLYQHPVIVGDGDDLLRALRMAGEHRECRRAQRGMPPRDVPPPSNN